MFSVYRISLALLLFCSLVLVGCDSSDSDDEMDDPPMLEATLSSIQANIFSTTCATSGCHAGEFPQRDLDLADGSAFASLVNIASQGVPDLLLVNPSNADSSYLIWKLEGNAGIVGDRMPRSGPPFLTDDQIGVVRQWIEAGAMDN